MRVRLIAPIVLGFGIAVACGGNNDTSKVSGGAAASGNTTGGSSGFVLGNGGSSANGTGTGNGTGFGEAGDGTVAADAGCVGTTANGQPIPVDLFFMVDITGSMNCPVPDNPNKPPCEVDPKGTVANTTRWTTESAALKAFVADPANAGLGVGIRFFPNADQNTLCTAATYATPAVEIAALPSNAAKLNMSIAAQTPTGQTPTVPSLTGAIQHAQAWAKANPTHRVAVVYSTDGYPEGCGADGTLGPAAMEAAAGLAGTPSIPTYVLGIGPNLTELNMVAASGGTKQAFLIDTTQNAATQLSTALASIRTTAVVGCTYTIPAPPAGMTLQTGEVNVQYTDPKGAVTLFKEDPSGTACAQGTGWEYSSDMSQINLCGTACATVKATMGGSLQVRFGCATQVGEPVK